MKKLLLTLILLKSLNLFSMPHFMTEVKLVESVLKKTQRLVSLARTSKFTVKYSGSSKQSDLNKKPKKISFVQFLKLKGKGKKN